MISIRRLCVGFVAVLLAGLLPQAMANTDVSAIDRFLVSAERGELLAMADGGVRPEAVPGLSTSDMLRQRLASAGDTVPSTGDPALARYVDVVNGAVSSTEYQAGLAALLVALDDPALVAQLDAVAPSDVPLLWLLPVDGFAVTMGFNPFKVLSRVAVIVGTVVGVTATCVATAGVVCAGAAVGGGLIVAGETLGIANDAKDDVDPSGEGGRVAITYHRCETYFRCAVEWNAAYDGHSMAHANTYFTTHDYNGTHNLAPNDPACRNPTYPSSLCVDQSTTALGTRTYEYGASVEQMYGLYCSASLEVVVRVTWSNGDYTTDTLGVPKETCTP